MKSIIEEPNEQIKSFFLNSSDQTIRGSHSNEVLVLESKKIGREKAVVAARCKKRKSIVG